MTSEKNANAPSGKPSEKAVAPAEAVFKNKLQVFPQEIRDKIDALIEMGRGPNTCLKYVKSVYRGTLEIPSIGTFEKYCKYRREQLKAMTDGQLQIQRVMAKKLDLTHIDANDKKAMLEAIVSFMSWRIEEVKAINAHLHSPQYERIITDDTRVILDTISAQLKLEEKLGVTKEKAKAVMVVLLRYIGTKVQEAYKEVHGTTKFEMFTRELQEALDNMPFDEIEAQVLQAFDSEDGTQL